MAIRFFSEEINFKPKHPRKTIQWIKEAVKKERKEVGEISYVFCSDEYLLKMNVDYLNHNTLTDIITFDYSEGKQIAGDIYISIDRIQENSQKFNSGFDTELQRVMIHGILHLCGYKDKKESDRVLIRKKENAYLSLWKKMFHVERIY